MWDPEWDTFFQVNEPGRYPTEDLIRFVAGHFYGAEKRSHVRILEVGCGAGPNLWYLAREGFAATGLDGSSVALEKAGAYLDGEGLSAQLDLGNATDLPYGDGRFDGVIELECLSALAFDKARLAIAEMYRVLKPGGFAYSMTLATGTTLVGEPVAGEENTFQAANGQHLRRKFGVHRLTSEDDIGRLFGQFEAVQFESLTLTRRGRAELSKHWLITCRKGGT